MEYSKKHNIICFSREELSELYKREKMVEISSELLKKDFRFLNAENIDQTMQETIGKIAVRGANDRDEHEVFAALFIFLDFYDQEASICFELSKPLDISKGIVDLKTLYEYREGTASDFVFRTKEGIRKMQLKRYRYDLDNVSLLNFITEKIKDYGTLGDMNLLIILQPKGDQRFNINFECLHNDLRNQDYKFEGEILVAYNQENKKSVIIQLHPEFKKCEIPILQEA